MSATEDRRFEVRELCLSWSPLQGGRHDLSVGAGEVVFLCGPSGSGKSSLLRALVAFQPYRSGQLRVDGVDLLQLGAPAYRQRVLLIPQRAPRPAGTLASFLDRVAEDRAVATLSIQEVAARMDLQARADRPCHEMSEGEWQRCLLALAIRLAPPVILLDEPLATLDSDRARRVQAELQRVAESSGTAVVWAAHEVPVGAGSSRVLRLDGMELRETAR